MQKTFPPEFNALMQQYRDTCAGLGHDHEHSRRLWLLIECTAPAWFKDEMRQAAKDMGLLPMPRMCNDQGEPLFSSADLAAHFGVPVGEVEASIERLIEDRKALGLPVDGIRRAGPGNLNALQ